MFGLATYLAANASKADIYTELSSDRLGRHAKRKLIVAQAVLGESYRAEMSMPEATRPPDDAGGRAFDSVWADVRSSGGAVDHLEVMLYDKGQAYPLAVATYQHASECVCAECHKRTG